ncbi:hypothetical protein [Oricola cellulosilytica]|uniref:Uncharacterized protein n=1 Tax=Oricola cellulosilytica TaxID=1429082 RepID=A0A4R0PHB9_9HYPH|nr:hypothetical protein [Oricola cellulosilytica]TCD16253.1 hypothetical protein E0D97_02135 [Oricola cellulosilytica]
MTQDQRNFLSMARLYQYGNIMRTTIFAYIALAAIMELGPSGYSAPLTVLVVAVAAYGILGGGAALDDVSNLRDAMDEDMAATSFGKAVKSRNMRALKMTSTAVLALIGIAELYALFA